jgi:hypothetical protein
MSERQDPAEQLLDVFVYAPLGLLLEARDLVPKLAEKGRQRMGGQVTVARMIGEMAVRQGQRRAEKVLQRLREQPAAAPATAPADPGSRARPSNGHGAAPAGPVASATSTPTSTASAAPAPEAATLAIPGYDTLSASQVLPRLEGLSPAQLEAVRAYEAATRGRKTVLTRIEQLRGSA